MNILNAIRKMAIEKLKYVMFKSYYRQIGFTKENSFYSSKHQKKQDLLLLATKLIDKIHHASNAKEYYKSYLKKKRQN